MDRADHEIQADVVLLGGRVYSVDQSGQETHARAVAIRGGKILCCGTDEEAARFIGPQTKRIDLGGKMVLPGFADVHNHPQAMATAIFALDLYPYAGKEEYLEAVALWKAENPDCRYIMGNGWSLPNLENRYPNKRELDAVCPDIPAALFDTSHHVLWANSKAMENANITKETPDPPGGVIGRNEAGEPTGIFSEDAAISLIINAFPDFDVSQYKIAIQEYQRMSNSYGITLAQDCLLIPGSNAIEAYKELAREGLLTMRFRGTYAASPAVGGGRYKGAEEASAEFDRFIAGVVDRRKQDRVDDLFQINAIKLFEDGGGPTSYLKEPFEGTADCGQPIWPEEQLNLICEKAEKAGFQIHVHAMGDGAVSKTLDAFSHARDQGGPGRRNAIAHLMLTDDGDMRRMAELEVIGAVQPFWMCRDDYYSRMYFPYLGEERTNRFYPMKSLVENGVVAASGSDWPVTSPNDPLIAIQCGVTRTTPYDHPDLPMLNLEKNPEYRFPLGPAENPTRECVDLKTMIQTITVNGAYAVFLEDVTGTIEPGKSADLVVLDRDLFHVPGKDIAKANVLMTLFRGEIVYEAEAATGPGLRENPGQKKIPNEFSVVGCTREGCRLALKIPVEGITKDDVYLLRKSNKISATTVSAVSEDGGKTYTVIADDWILQKNLAPGEEYEIYLYGDGYEFTETKTIVVSE